MVKIEEIIPEMVVSFDVIFKTICKLIKNSSLQTTDKTNIPHVFFHLVPSISQF
jgi:hypothetical protein